MYKYSSVVDEKGWGVVMNQIQERRRFPRFKVKDGTIAINKIILGPVVDISLGGMAFEYYNNYIENIEHSEIGFYHIDSGFFMTGLPSKIIQDRIIEPNTGIIPIIRKRRSIEFQDLTSDQKSKLQCFIDQHSTVYA